jgi:hypothetical protein
MQGRWLVTILTPQFPATRTKESTPQASVLHLRGANPLFVPPVRSHDLLHQVKETDKSTWANRFEMTSDVAPRGTGGVMCALGYKASLVSITTAGRKIEPPTCQCKRRRNGVLEYRRKDRVIEIDDREPESWRAPQVIHRLEVRSEREYKS